MNPIIFTLRAVTMQRLADVVGHGYTHWCSGSISVMRCQKLVTKFELNYHVLDDRNVRARRKRSGLGNAQLVLWLNQDQVHWWLLATSPDHGDHAAHTSEKLHDALSRDGRIEIDGFELLRLPKPTTKNKF